MLARIRKAQQHEEGGFTLIELLVVIIIIGILAAIAIPTFLKQRQKGWKASVKSDVKSAINANEAFATENEGFYSADNGALNEEGFNQTEKVLLGVTLTGNPVGTEYTVCASHQSLPDWSWHYDSATGASTEGGGCA